ncbi:macrolide ABC transporter ATP-binding protein [Actinoplanes sp. ATCC 53533]|uniref:ABC transporter ATP-binding protein n=1 Tax=Actinoplanes sp. ATCC 53533 TaxID=1288362 RepID=UPI000F7A46E2|nr:ABC transporter ATP-binding protein [Actinoplanes sp. ATCC 53533]RSM69432.1 macrolide ABC transporter ATP-binding protein [Actinoplanes sp. ATCC 53533]
MTPVVELSGLARTYPGRPPVTAVRPTTLSVLPGDYIALTGRSGSGKSTLLHLLGLLDHPTAGSYRLDGVDTTTLSDGARTALRGRRIGFIFQAFHLLPHRSAVENVVLALLYNGVPRSARLERAEAALALVGMEHRAHALPNTLSGGERQRVAIARALVTEPSLLLADEPTGNLDSVTADAVLATFDDLNRRGFTVVVATHDAQVAGHAGRLWEMSDGVLTETAGTTQARR